MTEITNSVELVGFLTPENTEETRMGFSGYQDRCTSCVRVWKDIPGPSVCPGLEDFGKAALFLISILWKWGARYPSLSQ